jgi:probable F420-dependent oxidoreductase
MRVGVTFGLRNPSQWREPWETLYSRALDLIEKIDELGFDSVWLSEHHFADDGYCPSPLAVAAAIAARTQRVRIGTNIIVLPLHHPLRIAEDCATVDVISNGRFELGVGAGYREEEFDTFGVPLSDRVSRMTESIDLIRRAWSEPVINHEGRHFRAHELTVRPQPVQRPGPPIWMGARAEVAVRRAGRIADGFIISRGREQVQWFREAAEAAGRDPKQLQLATIRIVHVAESPAAAIKAIGDGLLYHENGYSSWFKASGHLEHERELTGFQSVADLPLDRYVLGTPDEVVEKINQLREKYDFDELILWGRLPGVDWGEAERSLRLLAEHVLPRLRNDENGVASAQAVVRQPPADPKEP